MAERVVGLNDRREFEFFNPVGRMEVITGPMFCGKSEELIRRVRRAKIAFKSWQSNNLISQGLNVDEVIRVFKPAIDRRRGEDTVNSQSGSQEPAISLQNIDEIDAHLNGVTRVVAIDEAQFFEPNAFVEKCRKMARLKNLRVVVAGLTLSFRAEPWGGIGVLSWEAEELVKLNAICAQCGSENAIFTQRVIHEVIDEKPLLRPADYYDPIELIGATETYEARCRDCVDIPNHPNLLFRRSHK